MNRTIPFFVAVVMLLGCSRQTADSNVFRSDKDEVSFRYPASWKQVTPQSPATLVLLYASDGSLGTCNLTAIPSDRPSAKQFHAEYFLTLHRLIHKDFAIKNFWQVESFGQTRAFVEANFTLNLASGEAVAFSTLTMATVHNGKRYMLVLNAPREALSSLRDEFELISNTLMFSAQ